MAATGKSVQVPYQGPGKVEICLVRTTGRVGPVSGGRARRVASRERLETNSNIRFLAEARGSGHCPHRGNGGHHRPDTRNGDTWPAETADVQEQTAAALRPGATSGPWPLQPSPARPCRRRFGRQEPLRRLTASAAACLDQLKPAIGLATWRRFSV